MTHPLVDQLHFTRREFKRCFHGLRPDDAQQLLEPSNALSWTVGHLANQEQSYWLFLARGKVLFPDLRERVGYGSPPSRPPLEEMWEIWEEVTQEADVFLKTLTSKKLQDHFIFLEKLLEESIGTMLYRNIYHYWFHIGEAHAIRQQIGHEDLPEFVGEMSKAFYRPEDPE
jgi:uncharacterized damage-inducible protein DinB